jgi:hypothetical protein
MEKVQISFLQIFNCFEIRIQFSVFATLSEVFLHIVGASTSTFDTKEGRTAQNIGELLFKNVFYI